MKTLNLAEFNPFFNKRPSDAHKGLYGHILIVGGDRGFGGAPWLAGKAALRVGAGLVSIATHPDSMHLYPEIMCAGIQTARALKPLLEKATIIVLGPGLGQTTWSKKLFALAIKTKKPLIVDADALNLLAKKSSKKNPHWILTPHPGEAARLLGKKTTEIAADRTKAAKDIQAKFGGICVLKGSGTLIVGADNEMSICKKGNPGMATAGMGDVLSGVIAGLLGQGLPMKTAAELGVLIHAMAADLAAKDGQRGMIATDLFPYLRQLVNN